MDPGPLFPPADALAGRWAPSCGNLVVQVVEHTASTNSDLLKSPESQPPEATVVRVAEHQSAGRGRLGRAWASGRGRTLTFSIGRAMHRADLSGLSIAVGVALAQALEPAAGGTPRLQLKWPNDLWWRDTTAPGGGRKLGGVLIETTPASTGRWVVVGVGLNVLPLVAEGLTSGLASLQELVPGMAVADALDRAAPAVLQCLSRFEAEGLAPFAAGFAHRDLLSGRPVVASALGAEDREHGTSADGIDAYGRLRLLSAGGRVLTVSSGEVSVRPLQEAVAC